MNERRATKRALLTSITALVMCVVMLAGTTFAWFTDTASTGVNKIQAGNLKVDIVDASGASLENQTLMWVKSTSAQTGQAILWEPGATYELQPFYVKNEGNLAIRYEIKITGTQGDAKLLEAIEFYVNDATTPLTSDSIGTGTLMPKDETGNISGAITIKGHMKESAKNEYQGLSLDGIAITVYATQTNYEYDSSSNTYDSGAFTALADLYPVSKSVAIAKDASGNKQQAVINDADNSGKKTYEVIVPGDAMADDADNISVTVSKAASVDTAKFSVDTTGNKLEQFDVTVSGIKNGNTTPITVELFIGKGYTTLTAGNVPVKHLMKDGHVENLTGTYNASNGCVTFETKSFSPFAVEVPDMAAAIGTGYELTYYNTLPAAVAAAKDGNTITLLRDVTADVVIPAGKTIILDLNGKTLTNVSSNTITNEGTLTITGTGTVDNVTHGKAALVNYGTATLNGGNFTRSLENPENNKNNGGGNSFYTILNDKGATMTINEGVTVSNVGHFSSMIRNVGDDEAVSKMTINGGTFSGGINTVKNDANGELTINGGDFSNTSQVVIMNWNKATISGGTFEANASAEAVLFTAKWSEDGAVGDLKIEGGTYVCAANQKLIVDRFNNNAQYLGTAVISGGTFTADPTSYLATGYTATEGSNGVWTVTAKPNT